MRRTSAPNALRKLPTELEGLRYMDEYEVPTIFGFAVASLRNFRCQGLGSSYVKMGKKTTFSLISPSPCPPRRLRSTP